MGPNIGIKNTGPTRDINPPRPQGLMRILRLLHLGSVRLAPAANGVKYIGKEKEYTGGVTNT